MGTSSRLGTTWNPIIKVYCASKAVTFHLSSALCKELKESPSPREDGSRPDLIDYYYMVPMGMATSILTSHSILKLQIPPWWAARVGLRDVGKREISWGTFDHWPAGAFATGLAPSAIPAIYCWLSVSIMNFIHQ